MKSGAFILAFLFLVMSVQPVFIKWNSSIPCIDPAKTDKVVPQSSGCKKTCGNPTVPTVKKPVEQSEDPCNTCNPFMACNGCAYITEQPHEISPPVTGSGENTNSLNDVSLPSFVSDCWHPPELFYHL